MLETDCFGAWDIVCSWAYLACIGMLDRLESPPYADDEGSVPAIRESIDSLRSCDRLGKANDDLFKSQWHSVSPSTRLTHLSSCPALYSSVNGGDKTLASPLGC